MAIRVQRGSGNVFADLGFAPDEAANLQVRSDLMIQLRKRLEGLRVTQLRAARLLGVSQPRVSDLMRGRIDRFSVDMLIKLLGKAGVEVPPHDSQAESGITSIASDGARFCRARGASGLLC